MMKKADMIIDLQYGSTGKGLIAGYMADKGQYDTVVNANMPNAGHTFIDAMGNKMVHKVLPNGCVGKTVKDVMIGPGSIFSLYQLEMELDDLRSYGYDHFDLWIHEDATVLTDNHKEAEKQNFALGSIGSTQQGTVAAMIQKLERDPERDASARHRLKNLAFWGARVISQHDWLTVMHNAKEILIEGAQGYSLGLNAGFYPYCTSRDCTPARFLADCGVAIPYLRRVIGTARMHPIRVGGTSGPGYWDQDEITWDSIGQKPEFTTVTKRERRLFTWSQVQIEEALLACRPDHVFLNFCNYAPVEVSKTIGKILTASYQVNCPTIVTYTGWGPTVNDVKERMMDPCDMTRMELGRGNG